MWIAEAEYADGFSVIKNFPYRENGNYHAECERQHELEEWLVTRHEGCTSYSVSYVEA